MSKTLSREAAKARREEEEILLSVAKAVYAEKPFSIAQSLHVLDGSMTRSVLSWNEAPVYYQLECKRIALAAIKALRAFASSRESQSNPALRPLGPLGEKE